MYAPLFVNDSSLHPENSSRALLVNLNAPPNFRLKCLKQQRIFGTESRSSSQNLCVNAHQIRTDHKKLVPGQKNVLTPEIREHIATISINKEGKMKSVFRTLLVALVAVSITTTASIASAKEKGAYGWLTQGAEVLPKGTYALEVRLGWPSTDFGIHIPLGAKFELTPFITIDYGFYDALVGAPTIGNTLGFQLKGLLWKSGGNAISLGADIGFAMNYVGYLSYHCLGFIDDDDNLYIFCEKAGFLAAFQIGGPELRYSHRWDNPRVAIVTGLRMPIRVWLTTRIAEIPMLYIIGAEFNLVKNFNMHFNLEVGPLVFASELWSGVGLYAGGQFGISYLW